MNQIIFKFLIIIALIYNNANAFANDLARDGIEVSGSGSVNVIPDNFILSLNVTERGRVLSKLKSLVDKKSNSVIQAAKKSWYKQ